MRLLVFLLVAVAAPAWASNLFAGSKVFPAVTIASEHRFNGMSLSDGDPALQVSLHLWRSDDYYAGVWMTNVDFRDSANTSIEVDTYVGRNFEVSGTDLKLEGMYSAFNDHEPGAKYDFFQVKFEASRDFGPFTPRTSIQFSPSGSFGAGKVWQLRTGGTLELSEWLNATIVAGRGLYENSSERNYWEAGFTASWKTIHFELKYVGMDTDLRLCGFVDWCESAVVGRITFATY